MKRLFLTALAVLAMCATLAPAETAHNLLQQNNRVIAPYSLSIIPELLRSNANVFFVDNEATNASDAADGQHGETPDLPFRTYNYAVGRCTAGQNNIIVLMPYSIERYTAAGAVDVDVSGITTIALGYGPARPRFVFDHADATFVAGRAGDGATFMNVTFQASVTGVTVGVQIEDGADNVSFIDCEWLEGEAIVDEFVTAVDVVTEANDLSFIRCRATSADAAGATAFLDIGDGVVTRLRMEDCWLYGDYATAAVFSDQSNIGCAFLNTVFVELNTDEYGIEFQGTGSRGVVRGCTFITSGNYVDMGGLQDGGGNKTAVYAADSDTISYGSFSQEDDGITAAKIAANAIGASELAADAIGAAELAADSITSSEIANDAIDAGAIADSAIDAATFSANAIDAAALADDAIDAGAIATNAIGAAEIASGAITSEEIATGAIDADAIAADAIGSSEIAADAIGAAEIAQAAIGADELAADAIGSSEIAADAIGASEVADDAIDAGAIAADAITSAEIANDAIGATEIANSAIDAATFAAGAIAAAGIADAAIDWATMAADWKNGIEDDIVAAMDANSTSLDILSDLAGISELGDKIVADMDANSVALAILTDLAGISQLGDKIVADMDANSVPLAILTDLAGISQVGDKVQADMDANSILYWQPRVSTVAVDEVSQDLFAVAGGPIQILEFYGVVDVVIGATPTSVKIIGDATTATYDREFSTEVAITDDTVGTMYVFTAANPSVLTPLASGAGIGATNFTVNWMCPIGMIEQAMTADPGGAVGDHITWYMVWRPLAAGVTVTAQ